MPPYFRIQHWLELHWVAPSYSGGLLTGLAIFFFGAATNTLSGWLYVMSGLMLAILAIAAVLPERLLRGLTIQRSSIPAVSAGEPLTIELTVENLTDRPKALIQIQDLLPSALRRSVQPSSVQPLSVQQPPVQQTIDVIPAHATYRWIYQQPTERRGIYRWQQVYLRTAAPLGLFWCRRSQRVSGRAIVYPTILRLAQCPLVDDMGKSPQAQIYSVSQAHLAVEGVTRTLRPYRWGDSTRFVHWRTSARYGELRIRELETFTGGQELLIGLDSAASWPAEAFEQAVIAAASIYIYALRRRQVVRLWTAATGIVQGEPAVLETLAATTFREAVSADRLPNGPLLWITANANSLETLPAGSRWMLWSALPTGRSTVPAQSPSAATPGLLIHADVPLQEQLQAAP